MSRVGRAEYGWDAAVGTHAGPGQGLVTKHQHVPGITLRP